MNRYSFEEYLEPAISSAKLLSQTHFLCYLDLDRFKIINENCGHIAGDEFLRRVPRIFRALEEERFLLYCQPIVPLNQTISESRHKRGMGYEVLLRLQNETGKIIAPNPFLPVAEKYDLIHLIDRWVIRTLFDRLKENYGTIETCSALSQDYLYTILRLMGL